MTLVATLDCGTTHSRVGVWRDGTKLASASAAVGVRDTAITGSHAALKAGVANALTKAAREAGAEVGALECILASGMVTSALGLFELPHLVAPAGIAELAAGMRHAPLPEIAPQGLWFIPGVRNPPPEDALRDFGDIDFMRGEEVEAIALAERLALAGPALLVLPGSHHKFVVLDEHARIQRCMTTLSGELLAAITGHTVLAGTLKGRFAEAPEADWLRRGAALARAQGLPRAAFAVRALGAFAGATPEQCAAFLLGAVLEGDLQALRAGLLARLPADAPLRAAGTTPVAAALAVLAQDHAELRGRLQAVDPQHCHDLAAHGALRVAAQRGLVHAP